ncbi:MAG: rhodanese-like domain-containing protein [Flavobacteriales bacterium]|nr:rhodanese-like domain-containing protein [Flavobacteriales bacterium]
MQKLKKEEFQKILDTKQDVEIIDVREEYEYEELNIGGKNIPLNEVMKNLDKINTNKPIIFCCNSGRKSAAIAHTLAKKTGLENVFTVEVGVSAFVS